MKPVKQGHRAFTLIELLVVMGIMVLMMTIAALGWRGMRRGAELRGGSSAVRTTLMLARQQAVLKRQNMTVTFTEDGTNSAIGISAGKVGSGAHSTVTLTPGVKINLPLVGVPSNTITFTPSGGSAQAGTVTIVVTERFGNPQGSSTSTVWLLTGVAE